MILGPLLVVAVRELKLPGRNAGRNHATSHPSHQSKRTGINCLGKIWY